MPKASFTKYFFILSSHAALAISYAQKKFRQAAVPLLVNALAISALFLLHYFFPSVINNLNQNVHSSWLRIDNEYMHTYYGFHKGHPVFAGRALTTSLIALVHRLTNFGFGTSFVLVNFSSLFIAGLLIYILAGRIGARRSARLLSSVLFYLTFPILFAFFRPINTFDDPLQYVGLLASLLFFYDKKFLSITIALTSAFLARETSILLYPGFLSLICASRAFSENMRTIFSFRKNWRFYLALVLPLCFYSLATPLILWHKNKIIAAATYLTHNRWTEWHYNFQNAIYAREAFISCFLTLAFIITLIIVGHLRNRTNNPIHTSLIRAALLTTAINTPIVLTTALAQEARLFVLPLIFIWPLAGTYAQMVYDDGQKIVSYFIKNHRSSLLLGIIAYCLFGFPAWYKLITALYTPTFSGGFGAAYQLYFFIAVHATSLIILTHVLKRHVFKNEANVTSTHC